MRGLVKSILFFVLLAIAINAQDQPKIEIADGTKIPFGTAVYSTEAQIVSDRVNNSSFDLPKWNGNPCKTSDNFRINDSSEGFFASKDVKSRVYIYSNCDKRYNQSIQGVIVISNGKMQAHYAFPNNTDVKISQISDLDGNGLDEAAIFSHEKKNKGYRTEVRIVEFSGENIKLLGTFQLENENNILIASKIYTEKGNPPKFFESKFQTDGRKWKNIEFEKLITPHPDQLIYTPDKSQKGFLRHLLAFTFILQMIGFIGLLLFVIYEVVFVIKATETQKAEKEERKAGTAPSISEDNLPNLDPINCKSCGAGIPLKEGIMTCPSCGTQTSAPENYFDVAKTRNEINKKIRNAASYLKRAKFLSSNWIRYATLFLSIWLFAVFIGLTVLIYKGNFEPYQTYFSSKIIFGLGSFSTFFWIISLLFGFAIWSPNLKRALPSVELNEHLGQAENANCLQCGGAIQYQTNDLATICGYCGVEIYRAKLAWNLRSLTNNINQKAKFSLIEAQKSVEDAVWEVTGTPRVFAGLLILILVFGGFIWLISIVYDSLPSGIKDILELIGSIL